ncbi:MAG: site-specific integrase [Pseudomonadota bacterium]
MNSELNIPLFDPAPSILSRSGAIPQDTKKHPKPSCAFSPGVGPLPRPVNDVGNDPASLFDAHGRRKYLNADERERFIAAAATFSPQIYALCLLLHCTGCRISEALAVRPVHLDPAEDVVILQTLKQRRRGVFRMMPLPGLVMDLLYSFAAIDSAPLIPMHRTTAWEKVTAVMAKAGISGPQACPRGTRHGFGVAAVAAGVPITLLQRWLGHARLETTAIYLAVTGPEERAYAAKLWRKSGLITPTSQEKAA